MASATWPRRSQEHGTSWPWASLQSLDAATRVAFTAPRPSQRRSDHFGLEALVNLSLAPALATAARPGLKPAATAEEGSRVAYARAAAGQSDFE